MVRTRAVSFFLILALGATACSHAARSPAESSLMCEEPKNFCSDPVAIVCSGEDQHQYKQVTQKQAAELSEEVALEIVGKFGLKITGTALDAIMALKAQKPGQWVLVYRSYLHRVEERLLKNIGASRAELDRYFEEIRRTEIAALEVRPFPRALVARMKNILNRVHLELPSEYLWKDPDGVIDSCGKDGLHDDAFAVHDESVVVLCPVYLLLGHHVDERATFKEQFAASFETLAHELGHFIDSSVFPAELEPWHDCIRDVRGFETKTGSDGVKRIDPDTLNELTADGWAAATVAEKIRTLDRGSAIDFLREAYHNYCSGDVAWDDHDSHMPEMPRVDLQLTQTPALRARMGCEAPTPELPACDISGLVTRQPEF